MTEDCATRMFVPHGCNDDKAVIESFKDALKQRVGAERYQMWFTPGVCYGVKRSESSTASQEPKLTLQVRVAGQFALDRIQNRWLRELRGAAMQVLGSSNVELCLSQPKVVQTDLPLQGLTDGESKPLDGNRNRRAKRRPSKPRGKTQSFSSLIADGAGTTKNKRRNHNQGAATQLELPEFVEAASVNHLPSGQAKQRSSASSANNATAGPQQRFDEQTFDSFLLGSCNELAYTAMKMVCQQPSSASPLFICGPTGTGKSHMLAAIADQFRRRHRMKRVVLLSAEQFTNDFVSSCGNTGITAFRRRYREVDALLIDGMQFLGAKTATLREMLYTVDTLISSGRPLVAAGLSSPNEIQGLTAELAGRLASGLVCSMQPLDMATREQLLRRELEQRCAMPMPEATITQINTTLSGDGRIIRGVANLVNTLQRMNGRIPTIEELRQFGGTLLRAAQPIATISVIESAVCQAFQLPRDTLRSSSQTRAVSEPRMLAMYLSRQLTSSAYSEIARHFGGRSHSTAISAEKNVKKWLENRRSIGRGPIAMSAQEAIDRVESLLRTG